MLLPQLEPEGFSKSTPLAQLLLRASSMLWVALVGAGSPRPIWKRKARPRCLLCGWAGRHQRNPVLDRAGEAAGRPEERLQVQIQDRQDASPLRVIPSHVEEPNLYAVEHAGVVVEPDRQPYLPAIDVVVGGYG